MSHQGKECRVREQIRQLIANAARPPRTAAGSAPGRNGPDPAHLGGDVVRLARIAASIHMAESVLRIGAAREHRAPVRAAEGRP
jgi:hypothetical protein